eukprot:PhF_6_TR42816/c0_g1_i1/m.64822
MSNPAVPIIFYPPTTSPIHHHIQDNGSVVSRRSGKGKAARHDPISYDRKRTRPDHYDTLVLDNKPFDPYSPEYAVPSPAVIPGGTSGEGGAAGSGDIGGLYDKLTRFISQEVHRVLEVTDDVRQRVKVIEGRLLKLEQDRIDNANKSKEQSVQQDALAHMKQSLDSMHRDVQGEIKSLKFDVSAIREDVTKVHRSVESLPKTIAAAVPPPAPVSAVIGSFGQTETTAKSSAPATPAFNFGGDSTASTKSSFAGATTFPMAQPTATDTATTFPAPSLAPPPLPPKETTFAGGFGGSEK